MSSFRNVVSSSTFYSQKLALQVFNISRVRELSSEGFPKYPISSWSFSWSGWELEPWGYVKKKRKLRMCLTFLMLHPFFGNCFISHIPCSEQEPGWPVYSKGCNPFFSLMREIRWWDQAQGWLIHKQVTLGHQILLWECGLTDFGVHSLSTLYSRVSRSTTETKARSKLIWGVD